MSLVGKNKILYNDVRSKHVFRMASVRALKFRWKKGNFRWTSPEGVFTR